MKIALGIQYDGTPFSGWQVQPDRPTVQQTLEEALGAFAGSRFRQSARDALTPEFTRRGRWCISTLRLSAR